MMRRIMLGAAMASAIACAPVKKDVRPAKIFAKPPSIEQALSTYVTGTCKKMGVPVKPGKWTKVKLQGNEIFRIKVLASNTVGGLMEMATCDGEIRHSIFYMGKATEIVIPEGPKVFFSICSKKGKVKMSVMSSDISASATESD